MHTMGHRVVKLEPVHGFAAETTAATVILGAAQLGMPVSTTQVISSAIMGVGIGARLARRALGGRPRRSSWPGSSPSRHRGLMAALVWLVFNALGLMPTVRRTWSDSD